jgi:acyl-CoA reductase-like NAD-dependent aldehyde dehydrogenase
MAWMRVNCAERAQWLRACLSNTMAHATDLAVAGTEAKGSGGSGIGDEL